MNARVKASEDRAEPPAIGTEEVLVRDDDDGVVSPYASDVVAIHVDGAQEPEVRAGGFVVSHGAIRPVFSRVFREEGPVAPEASAFDPARSQLRSYAAYAVHDRVEVHRSGTPRASPARYRSSPTDAPATRSRLSS